MIEITNAKREGLGGVKRIFVFKIRKEKKKREGSQLWARAEQGFEAPDVHSPAL